MLEHGGRLGAAARCFGIPRVDWLDLSTGIAPWPYPLPAVPAEVWQRLPEADDGLDEVVIARFGAPGLAVPGTQAALQWLPRLRLPTGRPEATAVPRWGAASASERGGLLFPPGRVALPAPIYAEHPAAWQAAGHTLVAWEAPSDYAVLCNPNNPTGQRYTRAELLQRAKLLSLLVVDEAFLVEEADSLAGEAENVVVLKSLGKFFGLAGLRSGVVFGPPALRESLRAALGPWAVSHPARWAARQALADTAWQAAQRERLITASRRLAELLEAHGLANTGTALFRYAPTPRAAALCEALARRAILVRRFDAPSALRFGLPGDEAGWQRLANALKEIA